MKRKVLLSSILSIVLCLSLIVGSTYALFTSESKVNVAITSGTVDVVAVLKEGSLKAFSGQWNETLNAYESVEVSADSATSKTFANGGTVVAGADNNVLTISKITPMDKVSFVIAVTNNSDVAIQYQTVISTLLTTTAADGTSLMDGLTVTIDGIEATKVGNNAVTNWSRDFAEGETKEISVEIELPEYAGNVYKNLGAEICYAVNAVQGNAHVENPDATDDATYIYTVADLKAFAAKVNAGNTYLRKTVKLMANLDLANESFTPIGNDTNKFQGTFDGGNFTISNLKIDAAGQNNIGFFGFTTNGAVKNITFHNAEVTGRLNVGVVAGTPYTTSYENITLTGDIKVNGMSYVGGAFGKNVYADITNVTIDATEDSYVKANSVENGTAYRTYVGGVAGFVGEGSHTFTDVVSNLDVYGSTCDVGGIVGIAHYGTSYVRCVSTGDVTITNATEVDEVEEMGGIAGVWNNGGANVTFEDCVYTGTLSANITDGVDLSDNTITGAAYSTTGTGELVIIVNGAIQAEAATINEINAQLKKANGAPITIDVGGASLGEYYYDIKFTDGMTLKNATFTYFYGGNAPAGGVMTFEGCVFDATGDTYAANFDSGNGKLVFNNCDFYGWCSFGSALESVEFNNCTFYGGGTYGIVRSYVTCTMTDCTFDFSAVNPTDNYIDGLHAYNSSTMILNGCRNVNGEVADICCLDGDNQTNVIYIDGVLFVPAE